VNLGDKGFHYLLPAIFQRSFDAGNKDLALCNLDQVKTPIQLPILLEQLIKTPLNRHFVYILQYPFDGIDAQGILPHGSPQDVREEVFRVREILGPNLIISPSHEAILPDVPPDNVAALAEAAHQH